MAIYSMTGFGRGEAAAGGIKAVVELKSVNHKQFDCRIDLPPALERMESMLREQIHGTLARGHVACRVQLDCAAVIRRRAARVDAALAEAYLARLRNLARRLKLKDDLSAASLLGLPQVVRFENPELNLRACQVLARRGLGRALTALRGMQAREGRALGRDLAARLGQLRALAARIGRRAPEIARAYRQALLKRIRDAEVEVRADDPRLLKEVAVFADRSDIAEELTRLQSHLQQSAAALRAGGPVGRTLDFLVQELLREINTLGSKASDRLVAADVVRFKAELERIREQVQNIA